MTRSGFKKFKNKNKSFSTNVWIKKNTSSNIKNQNKLRISPSSNTLLKSLKKTSWSSAFPDKKTYKNPQIKLPSTKLPFFNLKANKSPNYLNKKWKKSPPFKTFTSPIITSTKSKAFRHWPKSRFSVLKTTLSRKLKVFRPW